MLGSGQSARWMMPSLRSNRLMKQSNGGFGCYLLLAHEWANPLATRRSYELIAKHVFPQFQGQGWSTPGPRPGPRRHRPEMAAEHLQAVEAVTAKYRAEVTAKE